MDHEIEHDGHVGTARIERREPIAFDEAWRIHEWHGGAHGTIEALHVAHLQQHAGGAGTHQQVVGLVERYGKRLLDKDMLAAIESGRRHGVMCGGRHHDGHGIHLIEQSRQRREHADVELRGDVGRTTGVVIHEAGEAVAAEIAKNAHVVHTEATGTDDADARRIALREGARLRGHGRGSQNPTPRRLASMKSRKCCTSGSMINSARAFSTP